MPRLLELPAFDALNVLLSALPCHDTCISGRLEAYSCKSNSSEKKLFREIEERIKTIYSSPPLFPGAGAAAQSATEELNMHLPDSLMDNARVDDLGESSNGNDDTDDGAPPRRARKTSQLCRPRSVGSADGTQAKPLEQSMRNSHYTRGSRKLSAHARPAFLNSDADNLELNVTLDSDLHALPSPDPRTALQRDRTHLPSPPPAPMAISAAVAPAPQPLVGSLDQLKHQDEVMTDGEAGFHSPTDDEGVLSSSPFGDLNNSASRKTFFYLIATLNAAYPDYDFSTLPPCSFRRLTTLPEQEALRREMLALLYSHSHGDGRLQHLFGRSVWDAMDLALREASAGGLLASEWYLFEPSSGGGESGRRDDENPLLEEEQGSIWSYMIFIFNKKSKRVVMFTCNCKSLTHDLYDDEAAESDTASDYGNSAISTTAARMRNVDTAIAGLSESLGVPVLSWDNRDAATRYNLSKSAPMDIDRPRSSKKSPTAANPRKVLTSASLGKERRPSTSRRRPQTTASTSRSKSQPRPSSSIMSAPDKKPDVRPRKRSHLMFAMDV